MGELLAIIRDVVWGPVTLILILGIGMILTVKTGFAQIRFLPRAIGSFCGRKSSPAARRSFFTALAATVGTGNIAGVAGAVAIGGPGAVFWIWICGIIGMVLKYSEAVLAVRFRKFHKGEWVGGPMYMIRAGLATRFRPLAALYCLFGVVASFGVGNAAQVNAVTVSLRSAMDVYGIHSGGAMNILVGGILGILIGLTLLGGAGRIGRAAEKLVSIAALLYLVMSIGVLICCRKSIAAVLSLIFHGAFAPKAVTGGMVGSAFKCMQTGISRGVFTNEAGMGTAAIAHGGSDVRHPVEQGLLGILEVFIDTIVICTMTALVILCSGEPVNYGVDNGAELTVRAFGRIYGSRAHGLLSAEIILFAYTAILGWGLYGGRCAQYLFGDRAWKPFVACQSIAAVGASVLDTGAVWTVSEIFNGLMALPNLLALALLMPEVVRLTKEYSGSAGK